MQLLLWSKWAVSAASAQKSYGVYASVQSLRRDGTLTVQLLCRFWESNPQYIRAAMNACSLLLICLSCIWRYATLSLDGGITDIVKFFNVSDSKRTWMNDEELLKIANVYTHLKNVWPILRHLYDHDAAAVGSPRLTAQYPGNFTGTV